MLILDEHHQYFKDGRRCPGVSEICSILAPRFQCHPWYLERGRIGHLITEYHDHGELDLGSVDPAMIGYFEAYLEFNRGIHIEIELIEKTLYHPKYGYCGKPDRYGTFIKWKSVWDIKLGQPSESDELQNPAYLFLLRSNGFPAEKCFDVYLRSSGKFKVEEVKNPTDKFMIFLGGLKQWQTEQKLK